MAHYKEGTVTVVEIPDLVHLEQSVNERLLSDPPPDVAPELLPEAGTWRPLAWARVPSEEIDVVSDEGHGEDSLVEALDGGDGTTLFPLHPLVEKFYPAAATVRKGRFAVSASYRTVFFEPDAGCPLARLVPSGQALMIKLHLEEPLPGISGDRRLTPGKVRKCVELSSLLPGLIGAGGHASVNVLRERFGLVHGQRGAILRLVPRQGLVPLFAMYSRDSSCLKRPPLLISLIEQFGWQAEETAERLAGWLAAPILSAVLAGFQQGFSLEMHGQNTLLQFTSEGKVKDVFFRDLESVVYFPELRARQGLVPLALDHVGPELFQEPRNPTRWFNRNIDHDVGRIFRCTLHTLEQEGLLRKRHIRIAKQCIRATARDLINRFDLGLIARQGRWLPISRSPYGNGLRRGNYYWTTFR